MPLLFSYGSLQQAAVQLATFGRLLNGHVDVLPGYEPRLVDAGDGVTHANAHFTGAGDSVVRGTVFEVTEAELLSADVYERSASYLRIPVVLSSGREAWVYVDGRVHDDGGPG